MDILLSQLRGAINRCDQLARASLNPDHTQRLNRLADELRFELEGVVEWAGGPSPIERSTNAPEPARAAGDLRDSIVIVVDEIELELLRLPRSASHGFDNRLAECEGFIRRIRATLGFITDG